MPSSTRSQTPKQAEANQPAKLIDLQPATSLHVSEVLQGLQRSPKELPPKLFYDEVGSQFFNQICDLDEYYLTRTETGMMWECIDEITSLLSSKRLLIEYGSGSSTKTKILLDHLPRLTHYMPIDISQEHLLQSAHTIAANYPHLTVTPVYADYTTNLAIPFSAKMSAPKMPRLVYFPGSTIGNFHKDEALVFLKQVRDICGDGGGFLVGVDLVKDTDTLNAAYNDSQGVTAAFNLNLLTRLNRDVGADFQPTQFEHKAFYNEERSRIEMHLVSKKKQIVHLADQAITFEEGESIWTESSYKYTLQAFEKLITTAGFHPIKVWVDDQQLFSIHYLQT